MSTASKEYFEEYRQKNKEKIKAYGQDYYQQNKERIKEKNKRWRQQNPERYKEMTRKHSLANKEKTREKSQRWYAENKDRARATARKNKLWREYGLTLENYEKMLLEQKGCCAICQRPMSQLVVDHDHQTGEVRGLLCRVCNAALGQFQESVKILERAADYIRNGSSGAT